MPTNYQSYPGHLGRADRRAAQTDKVEKKAARKAERDAAKAERIARGEHGAPLAEHEAKDDDAY